MLQSIPGIIQGIRDPLGTILQLLTGVLSHFIAMARADLDSELSRYLFTTVDPTASGIRPLTANPAIARLNGSLALVADVLVGAGAASLDHEIGFHALPGETVVITRLGQGEDARCHHRRHVAAQPHDERTTAA